MGDLRHRVTRIRSCCQLSSDWAAMFVRWEWTTLPTCSQCSTATICLSSRQMQSWQEMLCTQLNHAVVDQFDSFLSNDLTKLESLKLAYEQSRSGMYTYTLMTCAMPCMYTHVLWLTDHEQAMAKYARVSKKKETERSRFDANSDLFSARKSFFQVRHYLYVWSVLTIIWSLSMCAS